MRTYTYYIGLLAMVFLSGCQNKSEDAIVNMPTLSEPLQMQVRNLTSAPEPKPNIMMGNHAASRPSMASFGITVDNDKITIDTKQTKDFLHSLESKMIKSFQKIEVTLRKEQITSLNETGIVITDSSLQIDLNKTKNFMEKWVHTMESVAVELDKTVDEIERSLP